MWKWVFALTVLCALFGVPHFARGQGTAFTYQGRLNSAGSPANGPFTMTFGLFTASAGGSSVGVITCDVVVSNGMFTTTLDFSNEFDAGETYWLEIGVGTSPTGPLTILSPRQQIQSTPYAIRALSAASVAAGQIQGVILQTAGGTGATNATQASINLGGVYPLPVDQITSNNPGLPPGSVIKQIGISPDNILYIWDGNSWSNFYHLQIPGGLAGIGAPSTMGTSAFFTYSMDWYFWGSPATQRQAGWTSADGGINFHGMNPWTTGALLSFSVPTTNSVGNGSPKSTNSDGIPIFWKGEDKLAYSIGAVGEQAATNDGAGFFYMGLSDNREFDMAVAVNTSINGVQGNYPTMLVDAENVATVFPQLTGTNNFPYFNPQQQATMTVNGFSNTVTLGPGTTLKLNAGSTTVSSGVGSPNGVVSGNIGDIYTRTDGGPNTTLWIKESSPGTTSGWSAK